MVKGYVKTAIATPVIKVADAGYNKDSIISLMERAQELGADITLFPELCITGATCQDLFFHKTLIEGAESALKSIVESSYGMKGLIFVGLPVNIEERLYNVAAVISNGRLLALVPSGYNDPGCEWNSTRYFTPGPASAKTISFLGEEVPFGKNILFEGSTGVKIGCQVGGDFYDPGFPAADMGANGAQLIVTLMAQCYSAGRGLYRQNLLTAASGRLACGYIISNAGDGESTQDLVFAGERLAAENGVLLSRSAPFTQGLTFADLDMEILAADRNRRGLYREMSPEGNKYLVLQYTGGLREALKGLGDKLKDTFDRDRKDVKSPHPRKYPKLPFVPSNERERERRCEEILMAQACALKKRLSHIGSDKAVVGISGGLDSTLALIVTVKAFEMLNLPKSNITAVTMPGFGTTDRTYDNACLLAKSFGLTLKEISIANAVRGHFNDIGHDESTHDVTYENAQARERTQILMDLANMTNALVVGTGDLSELALGWATYNGDHMSMYGVNGGIPKTLIRYVVRFYADTCNSSSSDTDKILAKTLYDILDTPVSPELLPPSEGEISQKTEDLVGPYELHDFFLYYMLRYGLSPKRIYSMALSTFQEDYDGDVIKKWLKVCVRRFFSQHFKRTCLPDGPKIGSVALSPRGALNMPTDACSDLWLKEIDEL